MSKFIVLGYRTPKKSEEPQLLEMGRDGEKARTLFKNPPPGIRLTEMLVNAAGQLKSHDGSGAGYEAPVGTSNIEPPTSNAEVDAFLDGLQKVFAEYGIAAELPEDEIAKRKEAGEPIPGPGDAVSFLSLEDGLLVIRGAFGWAQRTFDGMKADLESAGKLVTELRDDISGKVIEVDGLKGRVEELAAELNAARARIAELEKATAKPKEDLKLEGDKDAGGKDGAGSPGNGPTQDAPAAGKKSK